jgi:hypothetical protein
MDGGAALALFGDLCDGWWRSYRREYARANFRSVGETSHLVKDGSRGSRHDVLYPAQATDGFVRVLRGFRGIWRGNALTSNVA